MKTTGTSVTQSYVNDPIHLCIVAISSDTNFAGMLRRANLPQAGTLRSSAMTLGHGSQEYAKANLR